MTRIGQIGGPGPGPEAQPKPKEQAKGGFARLLEDALARAGETPRTQEAPGAAPPPGPGLPLTAPTLATTSIDSRQDLPAGGLAQAERTLETLERYRNLLGDPTRSLKEVAGIVDELESQARDLAGVLDRLEADHPLHALLQEVAVTALVASIKFRRGDYLP